MSDPNATPANTNNNTNSTCRPRSESTVQLFQAAKGPGSGALPPFDENAVREATRNNNLNYPDDTATTCSDDTVVRHRANRDFKAGETGSRSGGLILGILLVICMLANLGFIYFNTFKTKTCKIEMIN